MPNRDSLLARITGDSLKSSASRSNSISTWLNDEFVGTGETIASRDGLSIVLHLAESILFLQHVHESEQHDGKAAMLRGCLCLAVTKPTKIDRVTLEFNGKSTTTWHPTIDQQVVDVVTLVDHKWPFLNIDCNAIGSSTNADWISSISDPHKLDDTCTVLEKGFRTFQPGKYYYRFELSLGNWLPETLTMDAAWVKYELVASVHRPSRFGRKVSGTKEVRIIRMPNEHSLELAEPVALNREWEKALTCDVVIAAKSIPLGSQIPIAMKLTPQEKVTCHGVKVALSEHVQLQGFGRTRQRTLPTRRIVLFETRAQGSPISTFAGSTITASGGRAMLSFETKDSPVVESEAALPETLSDGTESLDLELMVQLPGCRDGERFQGLRLKADVACGDVRVTHWIKITVRLSRNPVEDPNPLKQSQLVIETPITLLPCQATLSLPPYELQPLDVESNESGFFECCCPNARRRPGSISLVTKGPRNPDPAPSSDAQQRPIHLLRPPSFAPPPFDDDVPPPGTSSNVPPRYEDVVARVAAVPS